MDSWDKGFANGGLGTVAPSIPDAELSKDQALNPDLPKGLIPQYNEMLAGGNGGKGRSGSTTGHTNRDAYEQSGLKELLGRDLSSIDSKDFDKAMKEYKDLKQNPGKITKDHDGGDHGGNSNSGGSNTDGSQMNADRDAPGPNH